MITESFKIKLDKNTTITVLRHQLFKPRWVEHFGSIEAVLLFIENYEKDEE